MNTKANDNEDVKPGQIINKFIIDCMGLWFTKYGANFALEIVEALRNELNADVGAIFLFLTL